ncbi:TDP-fucosamine acetyltransferase [Legionella birminghamensis]|uniref:TDP-fucosamine acetyltransferase n=1 Tax=Legionella birminghamensis TaxID=28083 RepID=A0A378I6T9_9GAMM|nr:hypothetical protein [Legionella birminghamensis]KTC73886.1 TDP-fucosamine acetyltransferase [Legionella birminghamensis]STX30470.1 TDP-fucosamine acetyltransferase [Legionella birminghamensis]
MINMIEEFIEHQREILFYYSPYTFLKHIEKKELTDQTVVQPLLKKVIADDMEVIEIYVKKEPHLFIFNKLKWDSDYFGFEVFKIEHVLYKHNNMALLREAIKIFASEFEAKGNCYLFSCIPCEDINLSQALCSTSFSLVETRLNYYLEIKEVFDSTRYPARNARGEDIAILKEIAKRQKNIYDRVHADPAFSDEVADEYLGTFIEQAINGFADFTLVPELDNTPAFGFLSSNNPTEILGERIAKLVLAAVDNSVHKGWMYKLLSEVVFQLRQKQGTILTTITQSANRPAIRTWEKAGFKLGFTSYVFSVKYD